MATEKKGLLVKFALRENMSKDELREKFSATYQMFKEMPGLFSKCFWQDQEKCLFGAFYIFNSEKDLQDYINSDWYTKKVPERWGCKPEIMIVDPGPILYKSAVTESADSWLTK